MFVVIIEPKFVMQLVLKILRIKMILRIKISIRTVWNTSYSTIITLENLKKDLKKCDEEIA